jgi:RNA polymerase sigma-70 factor (ECF subfamily)
MTQARPQAPHPAPGEEDLASTATLLVRARQGDLRARDALFARVMPALRRLAHQRLPARVRGLTDTDDLVQDTLLRAFMHMEGFEPRGEGAFFAYLRRILLNRIADELRRVRRRPDAGPVPDDLMDAGRTPLERVIGREIVEAYENALDGLPEAQRTAVILRVDFGCTHAEVAEILGCPTPDAARMLVVRGLVTLAARMGDLR